MSRTGCNPSRIVAVFLSLALSSGTAWGANPATYSRQLNWGVFSYGGARLWDNTSAGSVFRNWTADRYKYTFGNNSVAAQVDSVLDRNPEHINASYVIHLRQITDTQAIRQWCDTTPGCVFSNLLYHTGASAADSINIQVNATGSGFGSFFQKTPGGSKPVIMPGFASQLRVLWNEREYQYMGAWLGYKLSQEALVDSANAVFMDEFSHIRKTGANESGLWVNAFPFRDSTTSYWAYSNFRSVTPAWSGSLTHTQIRDSVAKLFIKAMTIVGDSLEAHGLIGFPNGASDWGPYTSTSNWYGDGDTTSQVLGGYIPGEFCFYYPGTDNEGQWCRKAVTAAYNARNRGGHFVIMQAAVGRDSSATPPFSISRSQMLNLGFHLEILFSGTTTYGFTLHNNPYNNLYFDYDDRDGTFNPGQIADTITNWCYAFGKYFGVPNNTRDTSNTVTDLAGNSTRLRITTLTKPASTDTQTISIMRYAESSWSRDSAATRATYTLPGALTFYELRSNGTYITGKTGGDTIHVGNGQARIFVTDTVLANAGVASTPSPSLLVDSVHNDAIGELDTLRTRVTASASITAGDSLILVYSLVGFAACDSSSSANSIRRSASSAGVQYTNTFVLSNSETYTLYCAAWHWNATTGWSTRAQTSRTYTAAAVPPISSGSHIKWIRRQ